MNIIFKIVEYLPDTEQVIVKYARKNSHKSIDDHPSIALSSDVIDTTDHPNIVESISQYGEHILENDENHEDVLESNKVSSKIESSSLEDYVGRIYGTETKGLWAKSKRLTRIDIEWHHLIEHIDHLNFFFAFIMLLVITLDLNHHMKDSHSLLFFPMVRGSFMLLMVKVWKNLRVTSLKHYLM